MVKLIKKRLINKKVASRMMHRLLIAVQLICALTWNSSLYANPTDGNVVAGAANISQSGHVLKIDQSSDRAIINWGGFSIGAGETVKFNQPGANSAILNRVIGGDPSAIMGSMQSNGQVFLINPNGIVFGAGARVDVGSIVASTLNISDSQFMAGSGTYDFKGNSKAGVYNFGEIRALQGNIYLIGAQVGNAGLLQAKGNVGLAAGQDVRLVDSAHPHLVVRPTSESIGGTGVSNSGTIEALQAELVANGGNVYALAINNTGTIRATGSKTVGGRVYLTAEGGDIATSGDIIAKQGTDGGYVEINNGGIDGSLVSINGNIDVSGVERGGAVFVRTANLNLIGSNINTSGTIPGMMNIVFGEDSILYEGPTPGDETVSDPNSATTTTGTLSNPSGSYSNKTNLSGTVDVRLSSSNNNLVVKATSTSDSLQSGTGTRIVASDSSTLENVTLEVRPTGYNPGNAYSNATIYDAYNNIEFVVNGTRNQPVTVTVEGTKTDGSPYSFSITDNLGNGSNKFHFQDDGAGYVITKVSINGTAASVTEISNIKISGETTIPTAGGTIVVQKFTTGGDDTFNFTSTGGSTLPSSFSITTTSGTGSQMYNDVTSGAYSITEMMLDGWRLVSSESSNGTPGGFNVDDGRTTTVTFFNEKLGQIIVQKSIVTGSTNNPDFDFRLLSRVQDDNFSIQGGGSAQSGSGINDLPYLEPGGTYILGELLGTNGQPKSAGTELSNWDFTNVVLTKNGVPMNPSTNASQQFTVAAGDVFSFNYTNTERGQILISKSVSRGSDASTQFDFTATGSPSTVGNFTLSQNDGAVALQDTSGATAVNFLKPGSYTVTELAEAGWFFDGIDPVRGATITNNQAVVTVTPGGKVDLVFNNTQGGQITVQKNVSEGSNANTAFDFTTRGGPSTIASSFTRSQNDGVLTLQDPAGNGITSDAVDYLRPGTYSVTELAKAGWFFDGIDPVSGAAITGNQAVVTVTPGGKVDLVFNNTQGGQIMVTKNAIGPGGPTTDFDFQVEEVIDEPSIDAVVARDVADPPGYNFMLKGGESTKVSADGQGEYLRPGVYTVTELAELGWFFDSIDPARGAVITNNQAEVTVTPGGSVNLVFNNTQGGQITVTKKVSPGSDPDTAFDFTALGRVGTITPSFTRSQNDGTLTLQDTSGNGITSDPVDYLRPGFYAVTELAEAGWFFDSIDPVADAMINKNQAVVKVTPGGKVDLVYNNTLGGELKVRKFVWGDFDAEFDFEASGGASNVTPTFTRSENDGFLTLQDLDGDGINSGPVDYLRPGTYTVKELAKEGWFFDFVTGAQLFDNPEATVTVSPGRTSHLTFFNTQGAQIMVTKNAFGPAGSTTDFEFHAQKFDEGEGEGGPQIAARQALTPGVDSFGPNNLEYYFQLKGGESTKLSEDPQVAYVRPGYYIVSELEKEGWFFDGILGADFVDGRSGELYVGPGDVRNLTFYNSQAAQIMVTKNTVGPDGENTPFNFFAEAVQGGEIVGSTIDNQFVLKGGESIKLSSEEMAFYLRPGTYTVREGATPGLWFFQSITGADSVVGQTGTVTVANGEVAMLTFTNVYRLPILTFKWDPIYPEGIGSGFPSYGPVEEREDDEIAGNSSAGVFQPE